MLPRVVRIPLRWGQTVAVGHLNTGSREAPALVLFPSDQELEPEQLKRWNFINVDQKSCSNGHHEDHLPNNNNNNNDNCCLGWS